VKIYIGHDEREQAAYDVAVRSLARVNPALIPEPLIASKLAAQGLLMRPSDHRGGQDYDFVSNAPKSTRFAVSRFLVPILCQSGWALFTDCDVVFLRDPEEMFEGIDMSAAAVYVVKHNHVPKQQYKMVNQVQLPYFRKNWSSVMLFNCDHPANHRLTLHDVNHRPGRDLHAFYWLHDNEIGALKPKWNWLVNEQRCPDELGIAHFTNGGPWLEGWHGAEHDDIWLNAAR
jgi:hypothetical protein